MVPRFQRPRYQRALLDPKAVKAFYERELDDWTWMKEVPRTELLRLLPKGFKFVTEPHTHQLVCTVLGMKVPRFLFSLDMGTGKALADSELVLTPEGYTKISDLKKGDFVSGSDGKPTRITGVFPQGTKQLFRVTFSDGSHVDCCGDHLWQVRTPTMKHCGRGWKVKTTLELRNGPLRDRAGWKWFIPMSAPVEFFAHPEPLPLHPYVLGVVLGNGSVSGANCSITLNAADVEIAERCQALAPPGITFSLYPRKDRATAPCWGMRGGMRKLLSQLHIQGNVSRGKEIPEAYMRASVNERRELLAGLLDTDGWAVEAKYFEFCSTSERLAQQVHFLVQSLGGSSKWMVSENQFGFFYTIRGRTPHQPFHSSRKSATYAQGKLEPYRSIREITPIGSAPCTCIAVAAEDGLFLTRDVVVTHNSKIILDLIRLRKHQKELSSALIAVPYLINLESWQNQLTTHAPDLSFTVLEGSKGKRQELLEEAPTDVYLINYAGLPVYMAQATRKTKKGNTKRAMVYEDAEAFSERFSFLALDECHIGLSSVKSLQYQLTRMLSWRAECCYGTTGTPMGRDPEKFWPQMHVIDMGETLGSSLAMFHAAFFKEKENRWAYSGFEYVFDNRKKLHLHQTLRHRSLRYTDVEISDMPAVTYVRLPAHMTAAQVKRNEEIIKQAREAALAGEPPTAPFIRQRQTAAGFIAVKGEDDVRLEVAFHPNPKINVLEQFLGELDEKEKLVIFHSFIYSGELIRELLNKLKITHSGVGHGYKEPALQLRRFIADPAVRVFVANCGAGGTGVDGLQKVCRYALFYESPVGPSQRKQAEKRLHREGQRGTVHIYDIVAQGTRIDQRVLDSIAEGKDLFESIVNGKERIE